MKTKHTPGPWDWRNIDDLRQAQSTRTDGRYGESVLCASYDYDRGPYLETTDANRDLIAAAPDMLEALETLLHEADMTTDGEDNPKSVPTFVNWKTGLRAAAAKARAAVAKATKEKP